MNETHGKPRRSRRHKGTKTFVSSCLCELRDHAVGPSSLPSSKLSVQQIKAHGQLFRELRAVSDDDKDGLLQPMKIQQHRCDVLGRCPIEVTGRLVAQKKPRAADEG